MQAHHHQNHLKLDECLTALQSVTDIRAKSAMWKFYNVVRKYWTELDTEMIACRRRGVFTTKYREIEEKFNESIKHFQQYSLIAVLTYS